MDAGVAREDGGVDDLADRGWCGGGERADAPLPEGVAGVEVDRAECAVVGELEDVIAVDGGRELEQRAAVAHPQTLEGREDAGGGGEEAGVVAGVAVEGPGGAFGPAGGQDGGGLGDEAGVGVVDAAGAVALVEVAAEGERGEQHEQSGRDPARALGERGSGHALMIAVMADNEARSVVFAEGLLSGRVALVTGGGTGLGRETALELARCGARVVIAGRRARTLEVAVGEISRELGAGARERAQREAGGGADVGETGAGMKDGGADDSRSGSGEDDVGKEGQVDWVTADVREGAEARRLVETVVERMGRLDVLVNNAGGQYFTPAEGIALKGWWAVWRLNVEGMLNMSEAAVELGLGVGAAPAGRDSGGAEPSGGARSEGGAIVNVTLSPHHGMPGMAHSGAARATVEALTREMAERWTDRGIAVTAIAAGHFDTEAMGKYPETVRAGMARSVPMQRLGEPREHAWLVALLCSALGRALNGSTITLDGARDNWFGPWPPLGLTGGTGEVPTEERKGAPDAR